MILTKQIVKYNRWHCRICTLSVQSKSDVTSVQCYKENKIFSYVFQDQIKLHLFYCKISIFFLNISLLLIILSDTETEFTLVTSDYDCTESVQILQCHLLYQNPFCCIILVVNTLLHKSLLHSINQGTTQSRTHGFQECFTINVNLDTIYPFTINVKHGNDLSCYYQCQAQTQYIFLYAKQEVITLTL